MKILSLETSCDETAAAVIIDGRIASNIIASQASLHAKTGGVVPEVAAREHVKIIIPTIKLALDKAKTDLKNIDAIAVTQGPGLVTSLMVGIDTAKALAWVCDKPLIPINHLEAHIYANFVGHATHPAPDAGSRPRIKSGVVFPALILIVSGGHTLLVLMKKHGEYQILGETVDDAAGEAFDKTAKLLGLGYPGGPAISKLALTGNPEQFNFPRPMIKSDNLNFSFSGLKTAVLYEVIKHKTINPKQKSDFAASVQQAIVDVLISKTDQAIKKFQPKTIMLGGGVAANDQLRKNFKLLAKKYKLGRSMPKFEYCTDNAAMIGLAAYHRLKHKKAKSQRNFMVLPQMVLK